MLQKDSFGIQNDLSSDDMLLMLDYGIFYEFIPLKEIHKESPQVIGLGDVEIGKQYALLISTNAGLWRYKIGDTVQFTSIDPYKIKISGRTKHFINAFGEEVLVENAEKAIELAAEQTNSQVINFTAAPRYFGENQNGAHEWIIEFEDEPSNLEEFVKLLDDSLRKVNSDYDAKRHQSIALSLPVVHKVQKGTFYDWMKFQGKLGGQHKVPRLSNSREYVDSLLKMLEEKGQLKV